MFIGWTRAQEEGLGVGTVEEVTVDADLGSSREGSRTGMLLILVKHVLKKNIHF